MTRTLNEIIKEEQFRFTLTTDFQQQVSDICTRLAAEIQEGCMESVKVEPAIDKDDKFAEGVNVARQELQSFFTA